MATLSNITFMFSQILRKKNNQMQWLNNMK